jgi:hypothetical protein
MTSSQAVTEKRDRKKKVEQRHERHVNPGAGFYHKTNALSLIFDEQRPIFPLRIISLIPRDFVSNLDLPKRSAKTTSVNKAKAHQVGAGPVRAHYTRRAPD